MSKIVTEEWESIVWKPLGKGFKLLFLLFILVPVAGLVSAFIFSMYLLLSTFWVLSFGNITWVKTWNNYLKRNWKASTGKKIRNFIDTILDSTFGELT